MFQQRPSCDPHVADVMACSRLGDDESIGVDTYGRTTTPRPGNWGGIVFRNDFDNAEDVKFGSVGIHFDF